MNQQAQMAEDDVLKTARRFFTFDRLLMVGSMVFAAGMWWNAQNVRAATVDEEFNRIKTRLERIEKNEEVATTVRQQDVVDRANLNFRLTQMAVDMSAMRDEMKETRNEVRKIR